MKIFSKLFLLIFFLSLGQIEASSYLYSGSHVVYKMSNYVNIMLLPIIAVRNYITLKKQIENSIDAPEIVIQFCYKKCKA